MGNVVSNVVHIDRPVKLLTPDPGPAILFREALEELRADGRPFDIAFSMAKRRATFELRYAPDRIDRNEWLTAFDDLRPVWRAAYEGLDSYRCPIRKRTVPFPNVLALDALTKP